MKILITDLTGNETKTEELNYNKSTLHKIVDNALSMGFRLSVSVDENVNVIINK